MPCKAGWSRGMCDNPQLVIDGSVGLRPLHHALRIVEDIAGMTPQLHQDVITTSLAVTGDKALSGGFRETGFHAVAIGIPQQELICGLKVAEPAIGIAKAVRSQGHGIPEVGVTVGAEGDARHVTGRRMLGSRQAVGIHKMRAGRAATGGQPVHLSGEISERSSVATGQRGGAVIGAVNKHGFEQLPPWIALAGADADLGRLHGRVLPGNPHWCVERILLRHNEGGDELLGAGDLARLIGILLEDGAPGPRIDQDRRSGVNRRCIGGPEGSRGFRSNDHSLLRGLAVRNRCVLLGGLVEGTACEKTTNKKGERKTVSGHPSSVAAKQGWAS